jgi:hypothetical protein
MINPNATSTHYGRVITVTRSRCDDSLNIQIMLESGHLINELGFIYHKTVACGDLVQVTLGFSIMSDRYGAKWIRKMQRRNKRYAKTEYKINQQAYATALKQNLKAV